MVVGPPPPRQITPRGRQPAGGGDGDKGRHHVENGVGECQLRGRISGRYGQEGKQERQEGQEDKDPDNVEK